MNRKKQLVTASLLLAIFVSAIPALAPGAHAAAAPCSPSCAIVILAPGGALNSNSTVAPSFILSFFVKNFTLVQPGTSTDANTTSTSPPGPHNEGHIHVFVDTIYVTIWTSSNGIPLTLSEGTHTVSLHLVNDFHQEFSPAVTAMTTLTVKNSQIDSLQSGITSAQNSASAAKTNASAAATSASSAQTSASNAMNYSLGALIVSVIVLLLVAYVAVRKPKSGA